MPETVVNRAIYDRLIVAGVHHITATHLAGLDPTERAAERLAEARQDLAEAGGGRTGWYAWAGLTEQERADATVAALPYLTLLGAQPDAKEIVVERAEFARYAEVNGTYDQVLTMLSSVEA